MKRCMIVDDSSVIRKVAKRILGGPDMIVVEAGLGGEALSMCSADMPDVIVVDTSLPDMTTEDFIRQVIAIDERQKPNIVICMTEFDVAAIMRAKRAGAMGYILKPFDRSQLLQRFREMQVAA
ncbi:response regulator [Mesorhizobium microcysteis]|jgi:two-component system chemotaxis response regulator CheY|uniref:Response regulator n=1 Tax=Neoaquamicrobium microcysteis TaxID=2682781 RepID=A0A5D4GMG8_9HYPH|nr:response regulator [Mesorhizobium microcysteis]TYR30031.1 response regulator [Mesorhizobium microcysteis]